MWLSHVVCHTYGDLHMGLNIRSFPGEFFIEARGLWRMTESLKNLIRTEGESWKTLKNGAREELLNNKWNSNSADNYVG